MHRLVAGWAGLAAARGGHTGTGEAGWRRDGSGRRQRVPWRRRDGYAETQEIRAAEERVPVAAGGIYPFVTCTDVSSNVGSG